MGVSGLVDSWEIALRAERKSKNTVASYLLGARLYLRYCETKGLADEIDRRAVQGWIGGLLEGGAEASTARARQLAVRRFAAWLAAENEIPADPLIGVRPPKVDVKIVEPLSQEELQAMLRTCDRSFLGIRDEAIIRLMNETLIRAGELVAMDLEDLNVKAGTGVIRRGKGGKGRMIAYGAKTATALDRYLRARRVHKQAAVPKLWLGQQTGGIGYRALHKTLAQRAKAAGVVGFRPHRTRHTGAMAWLAAGGSEGGLMAVGGWSNRSMMDKYTAATASARAAEEAKGLGLGDL